MDINSQKIEEIVKQVLQGMSNGNSVSAASSNATTSRVAMLTAQEKFEIQSRLLVMTILL